MSLAVCAVAFTLVLPAELPDKTAFASLVLGTRHRPLPVFAGVAAAFAVHTCLAVVAGGLLSLLPHQVTEIIVAVQLIHLVIGNRLTPAVDDAVVHLDGVFRKPGLGPRQRE